MSSYKKCPKCRIDLKPQVPVCYVCGTPQPGFEEATEEDRKRFDDALAKKDAKTGISGKITLIALMVGWLVVLYCIALYIMRNQSLTGPGGPPG